MGFQTLGNSLQQTTARRSSPAGSIKDLMDLEVEGFVLLGHIR